MIKEAIGTGKTLDEARESALLKLNAKETDEVQFEVLAMAKPKTLGLFGGSKAEVRAFIELPDKKVKKSTEKKAKKEAKHNEKLTKKDTKRQEKNEKSDTVTNAEIIEADKLEKGSSADKAVKYLTEVLKNLGAGDTKIFVELLENGAKLTLKGENLGVIIGRRGETLDALQHLTSLAASDKDSKYYRVMLDTENYREKRERTLQSLARRTAVSAIKSGRQRSLEPMNPYERRIIHTAVQEIDGASSHSVGEGNRRHVVITPDNKRQPKQNYKKSEPHTPKKIDEIGSLYGRID